jgi:hypothetical protein
LVTLLAALVVSVPAVFAMTTMSASALPPDRLPLTVTNNSGRGDQVFLYVLGVMNDKLGYVNANGAFTPWPAGANPPSPAPDVSIPGPANGANKTLQIPRGIGGGRMYMSFGQKLKFFLTPDGLVQPAPWSPADPNRDILFDWSEFSYNDGGLWLNSSQVDMFSVPHSVSVTGNAGTKITGRLVPGGRNQLFDAVKNQPGDWSKLIYTRGDGTRLRVLAPRLGIDNGVFSPTYFDGYVNDTWNTYKNTALTVVPFRDRPNEKYTGRTDGNNVLQFTNASGARVASFPKPSTKDVFGCDGKLAAPNELVGAISRSLCAALHRSTLGIQHTQPTYDASQFYKQAVTDHYSRKIHAQMIDGKAYGFAFDDVGAFESLVFDGSPTSAKITLTAF